MVGQLPSKPCAGNFFLKVPEKEDLREKRERIGRGRGRALGGAKGRCRFYRGSGGKVCVCCQRVRDTDTGPKVWTEVLAALYPQNVAKEGVIIITLSS